MHRCHVGPRSGLIRPSAAYCELMWLHLRVELPRKRCQEVAKKKRGRFVEMGGSGLRTISEPITLGDANEEAGTEL